MILQSNSASFPDRSDEALLVAGLGLYTFGQILLRPGNDFVSAMQPIDYAHWSLYLGVVLMLPFAAKLPKRNIHILTIPMLLAGISCIIGMCVIDFIFWSLPDDVFEAELAQRLINTPVIWKPFITDGAGWLFSAAVALPALSYWRASRVGVILVAAGTAIHAIGTHWFNVTGYATVALGYAACFRFWTPSGRERQTNEVA